MRSECRAKILTLRKTTEPGTSACAVNAARNLTLKKTTEPGPSVCTVNAARNSHLEEDDGMFAGIGEEQLSEVGAAGGQNQFVSLELVSVCGQGHVCEFAILTDEESVRYLYDTDKNQLFSVC
jgi:hypothetical protein